MSASYYQRAFYEADQNHDGTLDRNEFRNFLTFHNADRNHDGRITMSEFAVGAAPSLGVAPNQVVQAFRAADTNHDGVLSQQELSNFSNFQHADLNHDGRIDPYEAIAFAATSQTGPVPTFPATSSNMNYQSFQSSSASGFVRY